MRVAHTLIVALICLFVLLFHNLLTYFLTYLIAYLITCSLTHVFIYLPSLHRSTHHYSHTHLHTSPQEQDNTTQRLLKEKTGHDKKQRTVSYGEKATGEAELCRKYADIVTYLAGVTFPLQATKNIAKAMSEKRARLLADASAGSNSNNNSNNGTGDTNSSSMNTVGMSSSGTSASDWEYNCYADVSPIYQSRIPFWVSDEICSLSLYVSFIYLSPRPFSVPLIICLSLCLTSTQLPTIFDFPTRQSN